MKTSIFDMNFTLPPLIEMTQVEKDMPCPPPSPFCCEHICVLGEQHENIHL